MLADRNPESGLTGPAGTLKEEAGIVGQGSEMRKLPRQVDT